MPLSEWLRCCARHLYKIGLNIGIVFPHKDGIGFNIMLQAFPLDGKIVCREIAEDEEANAVRAAIVAEHKGERHD